MLQKKFRSDRSQKIIFIATKVKDIFNTIRTRRIFPQRQASKNHSLIDQRHKIFKGTSAKKHFQMDNWQKIIFKATRQASATKPFSKRQTPNKISKRQVPKNIFKDSNGKNLFGMTKFNKPFPKRQASKKFEETSAKKC